MRDPAPELPHHAATGGQTQADLDADLARIPGLVVVRARGSEPNVKGNTGYEYRLELAPGYRIADAEALVDFLVVGAWSVRDGWMPNTSIVIAFDGLPDDGPDLVQAAIDAQSVPEGSQSTPGAAGGFSYVTIWVQTVGSPAEERGRPANVHRLGTWPGEAPVPPTDAIVLP